MIYFWAVVLPPVSCLMIGKHGQAFLNLILCFLGFIPAIVHAIFLVNMKKGDDRNQELIEAIERKGGN